MTPLVVDPVGCVQSECTLDIQMCGVSFGSQQGDQFLVVMQNMHVCACTFRKCCTAHDTTCWSANMTPLVVLHMNTDRQIGFKNTD